MNPIPFNPQTSRDVYIFKILTFHDLVLMSVVLTVNQFTFNIGWAYVALFIGYPVYLACLRFGRLPGWDLHFYASKFQRKAFRPGHRPFVYPVAPSGPATSASS